MSALLVCLILVFLALGVPVGFALWLSGLIFVLATGATSLTQIAQSVYSGLDSFVLLAVPFFILAGNIMLRSGFARYLFDLMQSLVGSVPGGASIGASGASAIFGAMTGSSVASAAALGRTMIPTMEGLGYPRQYTAGLMAAGGTLGILIPPSVAMVIFAELSQQSVKSLFLAGVVPGLVSAVAIGAVAFTIAFRHGYGLRTEPFSWTAVGRSLLTAGPALAMPAIVLGGIYTGTTTPTEAAALSVVYGLFVGMVVYRSIGWRDLPAIFVDSARGTGSILFILSGALFIGMLATLVGIPQTIVGAIDALNLHPMGFLLLASLMLIVLGCFLDGFTLLTVVAPLLLPSVQVLGIDPIHFAIVLVLNIEIAAVTPPIGLNLFVIAGISGTTMKEVSLGVAPFVVALMAVLLLLIFVPHLSLMLL
ncbi:TRAP transporter large permease [Pseudooceanicola aestuarii]|uniref:TRAP transporter large permease n=1 Tax=Pseudooceanicola aestuarii TaxID=2697319 RepID=UPI0013CFB415|nr:TRAP transporter large permease [Pseudooceanicola aestuarii]